MTPPQELLADRETPAWCSAHFRPDPGPFSPLFDVGENVFLFSVLENIPIPEFVKNKFQSNPFSFQIGSPGPLRLRDCLNSSFFNFYLLFKSRYVGSCLFRTLFSGIAGSAIRTLHRFGHPPADPPALEKWEAFSQQKCLSGRVSPLPDPALSRSVFISVFPPADFPPAPPI